MDLEQIERLVKILENSSLTAMTVRDGDFKVTMSKLEHPPVVAPGATPMMMPPAGAPATSHDTAKKKEQDEDVLYITSPIVGTFYSASAPDVPAYVRVGDHVRAGDPVCIIEAMKLMNEITADFDCEIVAILVSNEQKVEYGQPLFRVKKL